MDIIKTTKIPFWGNPENNDMIYFWHLVDLNNLRRSKLIYATNKNLTYKQILTILEVTSYSNMEAHIMLVNKFSKNILTAPIKELVAQGFQIYSLSTKKELKNKYSSSLEMNTDSGCTTFFAAFGAFAVFVSAVFLVSLVVFTAIA